MSKASSEEASTRAATSCEACSLDRFTTREPSRSCRGEGDVCGASVRRCTCRRSRRGMGRSTCARRGTEHERPVCAAVVAARDSYKPMVKTSRAQRASEGTVVVRSLATNNARGAKGPCGGHVGRARTREGMTGQTGSNSPGGPPSTDKVRQLQRRLWVAAKRSPERRFHALMDRMWRRDVLHEAWRRVKRNRGARASITRRSSSSSRMASSACCMSWASRCAQARIARSRSCGDTSRRLMAGSGRSAFRRSATE